MTGGAPGLSPPANVPLLVIQDLACTEISLLAFKESALMGLNKPDSAASAPVGAIWVEADGVVHCYLYK